MPTMALATAARTEPPGSSGMVPPASRTSRAAGRSGCRSSGSMVLGVAHAGLQVALTAARRSSTETPHTGYERLPAPPSGGARPAGGTLLETHHLGDRERHPGGIRDDGAAAGR